jgi:hypothetical protein
MLTSKAGHTFKASNERLICGSCTFRDGWNVTQRPKPVHEKDKTMRKRSLLASTRASNRYLSNIWASWSCFVRCGRAGRAWFSRHRFSRRCLALRSGMASATCLNCTSKCGSRGVPSGPRAFRHGISDTHGPIVKVVPKGGVVTLVFKVTPFDSRLMSTLRMYECCV